MRKTFAFLLAVLALILVACGGSEEPASPVNYEVVEFIKSTVSPQEISSGHHVDNGIVTSSCDFKLKGNGTVKELKANSFELLVENSVVFEASCSGKLWPIEAEVLVHDNTLLVPKNSVVKGGQCHFVKGNEMHILTSGKALPESLVFLPGNGHLKNCPVFVSVFQ